ncbi:lipoprotein YlpA [Reticulomyxa filosa]|uniref:Lipoprotein YlpA n=1 Tax=Reticulomyxa filosa TaxID=46433 RepID=X6MZK4_RETFI|nr:lipoprotein YlpA [Reticulomyxa filosa]|eukprot:ETO18495.1 lipoprotein YlpA [Reticulomyxa filosa]
MGEYKVFKVLVVVVLCICLSGCGATQKLIKHGNLEVETKMSDTEEKKIALLQIKNTTDKKGLEIEGSIKEVIKGKGYKITNNPNEAQVMIQVNILQAGKVQGADPFTALAGGYGGTFEGIGTGVMLGGAVGGSGCDMLGLGLAGGIAGTIIDAAVEVVKYSMITDLQISEKASSDIVTESSKAKLKQGTSGYKKSKWEEKSNWKRYQTRIISVAEQVNLKFEEAEGELTKGLIQSISGLL